MSHGYFIVLVIFLQVTIPGLQSRYMHSATALSLSPGLTEVTLFGGTPELSDDDVDVLADTTVLRFGEFPFFMITIIIPLRLKQDFWTDCSQEGSHLMMI